MKMNQLEFLFN